MPVYIKKYTGDNYFRNRTYVDSIILTSLFEDGFPRFRYETENTAGIGQYRAGDFDLTIGLAQSETSVHGLNIKDFFLGSDRDFYLLVCVVIGSQSFSGTVQAGQITADYNYHDNGMFITLIVKDILLEWANRCGMVANSTISWGNDAHLSFENYIPRHFGGITSDVVLIGLPSQSYKVRLAPYNDPPPQEVYAFRDFYQFITGQQNISRWETFKELAFGLGFNFEMYLNLGSEVTSAPEFIFNIFFVSDLENEDPITIEVQRHNEYTTEKRLEWLYFNYRYFAFSEADYTQGILFNSTDTYYTDTNHSDGTTLYPAITKTLNGKIISVTDAGGNTVKSVITDIDCTEFALKIYNYSFVLGLGIGKLFPLTAEGVLGGGMAYAHIFHTFTGFDNYNFNPIQRYAVTNYRRYLKGLQKAKALTVTFSLNTNIKLWRTVVLNDGAGDETYYISAVRNIDLLKNKAEIELIKLT